MNGPGMNGPGMRRPGRGGPGMGGRVWESLNLTQEQRSKLRQQGFEHGKVSEKLHSDMRIKRLELEELMSSNNPDRARIDSKMKELSDLRLASQKARLDQRDSMMQVLTPEQREKLRQSGGEPGGGPGRGPGRRGFGPPPM